MMKVSFNELSFVFNFSNFQHSSFLWKSEKSGMKYGMSSDSHFRKVTFGKVTFGYWFLAGLHSSNLSGGFLTIPTILIPISIIDFELAVAS